MAGWSLLPWGWVCCVYNKHPFEDRRLIDPILWNYVLDNDSEEGKEVDESSSDDEDDSVVSSTPPEPPYLVAASITPVKSATPVDNDHTSSKYPHLSWALGDEDGYFDPADPSVIKSMQGLLQEINNLLSTRHGFILCGTVLYARVPKTILFSV